MACNSGQMRLQDISAALDMPSSTALRFLTALADLGYVTQDVQGNGYRLTLRLAELGSRIRDSFPYVMVLHPFLEEARRTLEESASLSIAQDGRLVYVDTVEGPDHILQTLQRIGKTAALHSTGAGKVILSDQPEEAIKRHVQKHGLRAYTDHTITDVDDLLQELRVIRSSGHAFDNEECEIGVRCIAVPIRDYSNKIIAAFSVSAPVLRLSADKEIRAIEVLQDVANRASALLGWNGGFAGRSARTEQQER